MYFIFWGVAASQRRPMAEEMAALGIFLGAFVALYAAWVVNLANAGKPAHPKVDLPPARPWRPFAVRLAIYLQRTVAAPPAGQDADFVSSMTFFQSGSFGGGARPKSAWHIRRVLRRLRKLARRGRPRRRPVPLAARAC